MKRWGGLFSALCLAVLVGGLWLIWQPQPPVAPPVSATVTPPDHSAPQSDWRWPKLPDLGWPDLHWPDFTWPDFGGADRQPAPTPITSDIKRILIEKSARRMTVWQKQGPPRSFQIALGFAPQGDKSRQGDGRTPEGSFRIDRLNRNSAFHLSLGLDYPQKHHRDLARRAGVDPGGDIMIHGQPNQVAEGFKVKGDWTAGCIALTNPEIEEIFAHAHIGTTVEIRR